MPNRSDQIEYNGSCHLAWHLTSKCNLDCPHCLRKTSGQTTTDLSSEQARKILPDFLDFAATNNRRCTVEFSGGNPLLSKDFIYLLREAHKAKEAGQVKNIRILGNPETFTDELVNTLKECEVDSFFISIDGLEEFNDSMRGKGSFKAALRGIRSLVNAGIKTSVKFTLVRDNIEELPKVLELAHDEGVVGVGVGHLITAGGGYTLRHKRMDPPEYRDYLLYMRNYFDSLPESKKGIRDRFMRGGGLDALLMHELGRYEEYCKESEGKPGRGSFGPHGQENGHVLFVVWSDGEVVIRREMQRVGYVPRDSFQQIYDNSPALQILEDRNEIRRQATIAQKNHVVCRECPVADKCLPGMVGLFGNRFAFAPNRDCWRIHKAIEDINV